ncbi:MAG: FAD-dependent oxidoreductase, partial [Dehalococcoidia bacterium]
MDFDLIVVGNGSAGDNIARTLGRAGKRVAVVEQSHLGGECLNDGCIPSKALVEVAKRAQFEQWPWDRVVAHIQATQRLVRGDDPDGGLAGDGVKLIWGAAAFVAPTTVVVEGQELSAPDVVLATGTAPGIPPVPGLRELGPLTNRDVFAMPSLPARLAVVGGGPIGLELGQALSRLGSAVTMF